jgi:hypothetical protein
MAQVVVPGREAAEVSHVEALGNEQLVTCRLLEGSHLVLVRATPEQSVSVGQAVHLEIDPGAGAFLRARGWPCRDRNRQERNRWSCRSFRPELATPSG